MREQIRASVVKDFSRKNKSNRMQNENGKKVNMAVLHGTRIWMTDGGEFLEDEEAAEFHLLKLVTAAEGRSD